MLTVITEIDGVHALIVWDDLFHGERVDKIPLIVRWCQDSPVTDLQEWQYLEMPIDAHHVIAPASQIHEIKVQYSADKGQTWLEPLFASIHCGSPLVRFVLTSAASQESSVEKVQFVFPTDHGPVALETPHEIETHAGREYLGVMNIEPVLTFFLHQKSIWETIAATKNDSYTIELVEYPSFHARPTRKILATKYKPAMIASFTSGGEAQ